MNEFTQHYDITADSKKFESAVDSSIKISARFSQAMAGADKQVKGFNTTLNRFVGPQGKIISNMNALNSIGAITEKQYKELIKVYDALAVRYKDDQVALAGISAARKSLASSIGLETKAVRDLNVAKGENLTLEQRLNAVGVKTSAQLEQQLNQYEELIVAANGDRRAQQQLAASAAQLREEIRRLDEANRRNGQSTMLSQFTLLNFGFAVQDASTFSQGFAFGLRSIANNLDGVFRSFGELKRQEGTFGGAFKRLAKDITSPSGLIVALNLVTTGAVVLFEIFDKRGRELDKIAEKAKNLTAELIKLRSSTEGLTFAPDTVDLDEAVKVGQKLLDITNARIAAIERQRTAQTTPAGFGIQAASPAQPIDQEELDALQNRSARLTTTLANQRELLADQVALEETRNILREQGLDIDTRLEEALQKATDELREQEGIRASMSRTQGASLATGQQVLSVLERETDLITKGNELRKLSADIESRRLTLGRELSQAFSAGALQKENDLLSDRVKIQQDLGATIVRITQESRKTEAENARTAGRLDAINTLLDEQAALVKEAARLAEQEALMSERIAAARERVRLDLKQQLDDEIITQEQLREKISLTRRGERDRTFNLEAQNAYLERQLALAEDIRRARQRVQEIDKIELQTLQQISDLSVTEQGKLNRPLDIVLGGDSDLIKSLKLDRLSQGAQEQARIISESLKTIPRELSEGTLQAYDESIAGTEEYKNRFLTIIKLMVLGFNEEFEKATSKQRAFFNEISGLAGAFTGIASDSLQRAEDNYKKSIDRQRQVAKVQGEGFQQIAAASAEASRKEAKRALVAYKAFAITEAIINAYLAGSQVWASKLPLAAKVVASAAVVANGFRIVNQIRKTSIDGGGGGGGLSFESINPQKERAEFLKGGLQAGSPPPGSIVPSAFPSQSVLPNAAAVTPTGQLVNLERSVDVNFTITPKAIPNGDIVFSVEQGLENRKSVGFRGTLRVPQ